MDPSDYAGPLAVTLAYIGLYYAFVIWVGVVKARRAKAWRERGEKFDRYYSEDREMLAADRLQLNTLEQMPPFLVLLWLEAVFGSTTLATIAGSVYVAARALYPVVMGSRMGRGVKASILASTVPGYLVILFFLGHLAWLVIA